jgi:hypothetical protein
MLQPDMQLDRREGPLAMYTLIALAKHYLDRPNARFHPIGVAFLYAGLAAGRPVFCAERGADQVQPSESLTVALDGLVNCLSAAQRVG